MSTIKETLLNLDSREKSERRKVEFDYFCYINLSQVDGTMKRI